jgi:hypothetical protein
MSIENLSSETIDIWKGFYLLLKNFTSEICDALLNSKNPIGIYPLKFICENSHLTFPQVKLRNFVKLVKNLQKNKANDLVENITLFLKGLKVKSEKIIPIFENFNPIFMTNITIWKESIQSLTRCSNLNLKTFESIEKSLLVIT